MCARECVRVSECLCARLSNFSLSECNYSSEVQTNGLIEHGQTLANRTKPGPSLQVEKWLCLCYLLMFLLSKQPSLKLKTRPKQFLGSLPLDIALPG